METQPNTEEQHDIPPRDGETPQEKPLSKSESRKIAQYWDTFLLWSGYDCYWKIKEIAHYQRIQISTVNRRLQWFKQHYPDQYEKVRADRASIRSSTLRLDNQIREMAKGRCVSYDALKPDIRDQLVKEKF
ncbi:MAG: hypothetical protein U9Q97_10255 [Acidobacteriota bacterium]|nr:hypothetical protein [Acidobacteriota bacterium]